MITKTNLVKCQAEDSRIIIDLLGLLDPGEKCTVTFVSDPANEIGWLRFSFERIQTFSSEEWDCDLVALQSIETPPKEV